MGGDVGLAAELGQSGTNMGLPRFLAEPVCQESVSVQVGSLRGRVGGERLTKGGRGWCSGQAAGDPVAHRVPPSDQGVGHDDHNGGEHGVMRRA